MKKGILALAAAVLALSLGTTGAFAAGRNYVDADGDGICDLYGQGCGQNYVDADGDGICDLYGQGCGQNYVDADGDSVCDRAGTGVRMLSGGGNGFRGGRGR